MHNCFFYNLFNQLSLSLLINNYYYFVYIMKAVKIYKLQKPSKNLQNSLCIYCKSLLVINIILGIYFKKLILRFFKKNPSLSFLFQIYQCLVHYLNNYINSNSLANY